MDGEGPEPSKYETGPPLGFSKTIFCLDKNKHLYLQENKIKREEKEGYYDIYNILQYCCDTRENFAKFPTKDSARSTCIVIEDSSIHMLDSEEQWREN